MYNRYIPQSDGTYQRSRIPDSKPPEIPREQPPLQPPCPPPEPPRRYCPPPRPRPRTGREPENTSVLSFLKQLLPNGLDAGDLIVVLLLLLMSGDCQEDQNTALLTLALYLFM